MNKLKFVSKIRTLISFSMGICLSCSSLACATAATSAGPKITTGGGGAPWVKAETPVGEGQRPDFELPVVAASGAAGASTLTLSELRGKVVIVDFWASWCAPCKEAMPFYDALAKRHPEGLVVLGVNLDEDPAQMRAAMQESPMAFSVLRDEEGQVAAAFGVSGMPTSFVFGKDGAVALVHRGFVPSDRAKLEALVSKLLAAR